MNCAEFKEIVHELAQPERRGSAETLDKATAVMARFHAETCEACAVRLAEVQSLALALAVVVEDSEQLEAPSHLEASLVSAFREHRRSLERARHRERQTRLRWLEWSALAAAAVVLFAIGAWNFSRPRSPGTNVSGGTAPALTATKSSSAAAATEEPGAFDTAQDLSSDFVPVPYAEELGPGDPGMVVRVEMERGALGSLGYPVDEAHAADVVQADLLVGEDGWPRAVRLVR
ncbi:MAG: hypothetical protein WBE20_04595 [Candidatus Acidiferrales bacterium]